jgi:TPR repeat protein
MFRKLAQAVGTALRSKFPAAAQPSVPINPPVQPTIHSVLRDMAATKAANKTQEDAIKHEELALAHQDLQNAVKELSLGAALPVSSPPLETLKAWQGLSVEELTVEQAEELARVYFEGSNGLPEDKVKALELWKFASDRGSIEGKYSRALCLKDGVGIETDAQAAYEDLLELAEAKNYHLAHVSFESVCLHFHAFILMVKSCLSQYSLAVMLDKGEGIPTNPEKAFHHYMVRDVFDILLT